MAYVAGTQSVLGSYLDPVADKVLVGFLAAAMTYKGILAWPVVALVLTRDIGLVAGAFWYRFKTKPPGLGFWDVKRGATFEIKPTNISKAWHAWRGVAWWLGCVAVTNRAVVVCPVQHRGSARLDYVWVDQRRVGDPR